jgi:membrane-associated phospholipid phosphatase
LATTGTSAGLWRRDPRSGWTVVAVGALGLFVLVTLLLTAWPFFVPLDSAISAAIRSTRNPSLTMVAAWATNLGSARFVLPVTLGLIVWMAIRRNWAAVVYIFMTVGVGWLLGNYVLKNLIHRPRPVGVNISPILTDYSMPSSHTLAAFLLFATLCVILMLNMPTGRHVKRWIAIAAAVIIIAVGWSRVYLGVHWFGDVVAACLFGGAWWMFTTAAYFGSVTEEKRATPRIGGN